MLQTFLPRLCFGVFGPLLLATTLASSVLAQQPSGEAGAVWEVIQAQWQATADKDTTWPEQYLAEGFAGWNNEVPAPRDAESTAKWSRYGMENSTTLVHELYPLEIVVHNDTAVAHYFYSTASENRDGERKTVSGRYTDILVREDGDWKFLAWHGGDDPGDED